MDALKKSVLDRVLLSPWLLISLLLLLAACWWSMPFNLFPDLKLSISTYVRMSDFSTNYDKWSLGDKLGFWIASKGWNSGPPPEFPYDFILFWHLTLSVFVYLGVFIILHAKARKHAKQFIISDFLSAKAVKFLFLYPALCTAIIFCLWNEEDIVAHKLLSLMIYPPIFCSMTLIALGSLGKWVSSLLIWAVCLVVAALSFIGPIHGGRFDVMAILAISLIVTSWALATLRHSAANIRAAF